jgi:MSHA pilin protein MshD
MCIKANLDSQTERGLSLIELLIFIVIVGIAATAILGVFGSLTRSSASMLPDKQAQAIAASMLREIMAQPDTYCDPGDPRAPVAQNANPAPPGCTNASGVESLGPEGETRGVGIPFPFDNVNDYNGYSLDVSYPDGTPITNLTGTGYTVGVVVVNVPGGIASVPPVPAGETLHITVTVTPPTGAPAILDGVRIRYAPNT